jgi:hypothetical protein
MARLGSQIRPVATPRDDHHQADRLTFFLSSDDCSETRPANTTEDFTVDIVGKPLQLEGTWAMKLLDISYGSNTPTSEGGDMFVMCNICKESLATGRALPVLRRLWGRKAGRKKETFENACYVPVNTATPITAIRIYITKTSHRPVTLGTSPVVCTLQLERTS